jgi:hypothetical protein
MDWWLLKSKVKRTTIYMHMDGWNPSWAEHLRSFGKPGTSKTKSDTAPKIA